MIDEIIPTFISSLVLREDLIIAKVFSSFQTRQTEVVLITILCALSCLHHMENEGAINFSFNTF